MIQTDKEIPQGKYGRCGRVFGEVFTSKDKAGFKRDLLNDDARRGEVNLRHRVLKCKKKYVVVRESKKKYRGDD